MGKDASEVLREFLAGEAARKAGRPKALAAAAGLAAAAAAPRALDRGGPPRAAARAPAGGSGPDEAEAETAPAAAPAAGAAASKEAIIIDLSLRALERAVRGFDEIRQEIERRIRRARLLRLAASIITIVLASSVVGSISLAPESPVSLILGLLALLASVITPIAAWLEGGESNLAQGFSDVAVKHAEAVALLERLKAYQAAPALFDDLEARQDQAAQLIAVLEQARIAWRIA